MASQTNAIPEKQESKITLDLADVDLKNIEDTALGLVMNDMSQESDSAADHYSHAQHNSNIRG